VQRRAVRGNSDGMQKYLASGDGMMACLPDTNDYVFELRRGEGECCGFDPASFVSTYGDLAVMRSAAAGTVFDGVGNGVARFSSESSEPCPPSSAPTAWPTSFPTPKPTNVPTTSPTAKPTTSEPTRSPSLKPTDEPTPPPSPMPTSEPTSKPVTDGPTGRPSPAPSTTSPTEPPTPNPTQRPVPPTQKPSCDASYEDFNLCFAIDMSGSVCNQLSGYECYLCEPALICKSDGVDEGTCCNNFRDVIDFSKLMVDTLESTIPSDQSYSVVGFGDVATLASDMTNSDDALKALGDLEYLGGRTNHADAITICRNSLMGSSSSSDDRKNIILLITDDLPSEPRGAPQEDAERAANAAKSDGIFIVPVMVIAPQFTNILQAPLEYLQGISSDGAVFDVSDFGVLNSLRFALLAQVSCQV